MTRFLVGFLCKGLGLGLRLAPAKPSIELDSSKSDLDVISWYQHHKLSMANN
jgi:hypothetical protein